jgi:hypothetical protein
MQTFVITIEYCSSWNEEKLVEEQEEEEDDDDDDDEAEKIANVWIK